MTSSSSFVGSTFCPSNAGMPLSQIRHAASSSGRRSLNSPTAGRYCIVLSTDSDASTSRPIVLKSTLTSRPSAYMFCLIVSTLGSNITCVMMLSASVDTSEISCTLLASLKLISSPFSPTTIPKASSNDLGQKAERVISPSGCTCTKNILADSPSYLVKRAITDSPSNLNAANASDFP